MTRNLKVFHLLIPLGDTTWIRELKLLLSFVITQPHAAYSAFTHGLVSKWLFIVRTIPNVDDLFHPLEDCIRHSFISVVTGHPLPSDLDRFFGSSH